eukprot:5849360-Karenia_brevis.AAC.1
MKNACVHVLPEEIDECGKLELWFLHLDIICFIRERHAITNHLVVACVARDGQWADTHDGWPLA